ncbi:hypothetical protein [Mesorhizobium argentiipisi]|uniref:Uncharacterized protein n=1 Tax=Mesorhizobium argentiipisi TaxID=3015175 RepID=A0ABU8K788_9HYPH
MAKTINKGLGVGQPGSDQPFLDTTAYGSGPGDTLSDASENAAITHHVAASFLQNLTHTTLFETKTSRASSR